MRRSKDGRSADRQQLMHHVAHTVETEQEKLVPELIETNGHQFAFVVALGEIPLKVGKSAGYAVLRYVTLEIFQTVF